MGELGFSAGTTTNGTLKLDYNNGTNGLGGVDFTLGGAGDRIIVNMTSADQIATVSMWLTDINGNVCSLENNPVAMMGVTQTLQFPYADFNIPPDCNDDIGMDDIDMEKIDRVMLMINGSLDGDYKIDLIGVPQMRVGGMVGSMSTASLLVAGAQADMGLWGIALVGVVGTSAAIIYKTKSNKSEQ